MGVPFLGIVLERNISLFSLHIIIIVEVLESHFLSCVVILSDTCEHFLVECTFLVVKGIAAQGLALEIHGHFLQQLVGGGEESIAGIVGLYLLYLVAIKEYNGVRFLSCITCVNLLQICSLGLQAATHILIHDVIHIFYIVTVEFLDTFQLPFGNHLTGTARSIGDIALYNSSVTTIDVLDTLLVCNLPIIVGRTVTLADDTAEITALAGVELAVSLSVHLLATVCDSHLSVVVHGGEH